MSHLHVSEAYSGHLAKYLASIDRTHEETAAAGDSGTICICVTPHKSSGRNNSIISGNHQEYLVGKYGSPQIYRVVTWPRFMQNNIKN